MKVCVFSKIMSAAPFAPLMGGGDKRVIESNPINLGNVNPSGHGMNGSVYDSCGVCPTLTTNKGEGTKAKTHFRVRKLTQKECWRLMGFSDEDFYKAQAAMNQNLYGGKDRSGSQLYKQAGNSIVVDVLCAIMKELYEAMPYLFDDMAVGSFFSGIGAFEKALERLNINYELVGFSEIDKFAIQSYCAIHNVDERLNLGDIKSINEKELPDFDLMTWGFPCQDISIAR